MFFWRCREASSVEAHQVETDIAHASDAFERGQALRLCETLIRECLNIADMAEKGHIPWDAGVSDPGVLAQAARAAADYFRGFSEHRPEDDGRARRPRLRTGSVRLVIGRSATGFGVGPADRGL